MVSARKYGEAGKTGSTVTTHTHLEFRAQGKETCGVPQLQAGGSLCERMCSATGKGLPRSKQTPISLLPVSHSYRINGRVKGVQASFVVDIGAAITLLDKTLWDKVNMTDRQVLSTWTGTPLVGVEGTQLETWGTATTEIAFAGETFQFPVLVASSLTADAILGMDILDANKCTLEMANQVLRFPNRECLSACKTHHRNPTSYKSHWKKPTVSRPSISEMEVMAKVSKGLHQRTWLLEECKSKDLPVRVACALVNPVTRPCQSDC